MSVLTVDLRAAGFGGALDAIETAEAAAKQLLEPGGLTAENATVAANTAATATQTVTAAATTILANPVQFAGMAIEDAGTFLSGLVSTFLKARFGAAGSVAASDVVTIASQIQTALEAKV